MVSPSEGSAEERIEDGAPGPALRGTPGRHLCTEVPRAGGREYRAPAHNRHGSQSLR